MREYLKDYNILPNYLGYHFDFKHHQDNLEFICSGFNNQILNFILEVVNKFVKMKDDAHLEYYFEEARKTLLEDMDSYMIDEEVDIVSELNALMFTNTMQRRIIQEQL